MKKIFLPVLFLIPLAAESAPECRLPGAPPAFLDLVTHDRTVTAKEHAPQFVRGFDLVTRQNDLPNLLSPCRVTPVTITGEDPLTHQPRPVTVMSYAPKGSPAGNLRTVLLMPPTGGENPLDDAYAKKLCEDGMRVVLVVHWANDDPADTDLDVHDRSAMRGVAAMEDVVEYIHPKDPHQLGVLGTSVGAISSGLLLGVDSRVSTATLIVGGGDMPNIIANSTEEHLAALRKLRLSDPSFGIADQAAYEKALEQHVKIEPLNFVSFAQPKKVLFFMGLQDVTVPTADQKKLTDALGVPQSEIITHEGDHIHTILDTSAWYKSKISTFFQENLVAPTADEIAHPAPAAAGNKLCRNARAPAAAPTDAVEADGKKASVDGAGDAR